MELAVFKDEYYDESNQCTEFYFTCPRVNKTMRLVQYSIHKWEELPKEIQIFLTENATVACIYADKSLSAQQREAMIKELQNEYEG